MSENTKDINGRVVSVGKLPATKALKVQVALVNLCGEALFKAVSANQDDKEAAGAAALSALSSRLDSDKVQEVFQHLLEYTTIDGKRFPAPVNLDAAFADHVEAMWPTLFFMLQVNFRSFFQGSLFNSIAQRVQTLSPSVQPTLNGTSGDQ